MTFGEGFFYSTLAVCVTILFLSGLFLLILEKSKRGLEKILEIVLTVIKKGNEK